MPIHVDMKNEYTSIQFGARKRQLQLFFLSCSNYQHYKTGVRSIRIKIMVNPAIELLCKLCQFYYQYRCCDYYKTMNISVFVNTNESTGVCMNENADTNANYIYHLCNVAITVITGI